MTLSWHQAALLRAAFMLAAAMFLLVSSVLSNDRSSTGVPVSTPSMVSDVSPLSTQPNLSNPSHWENSGQSDVIILQSDQKATLKVWPSENERLKYRYKDAIFPAKMTIMSSVIDCDQPASNTNDLFSMPTWTCHNLRVNGRRLPYAYLKDPKVRRSETIMPAMRTKHCGDFEVTHSNRELCAAMLATINVKTLVTEVQIPYSSCEQSPTGRAFYLYNYHRNSWEWRFDSTGSGFALTLRCSSQTDMT